MKIGVVTFWWSNDNYGQLLQAWALQQKLKEMGHEPFLIRFKPTYKSTPIEKIRKIVLIYPLVRAIINRYKRNKGSYKEVMLDEKNKMRNFDHFREHHLSVSKDLYTSLNDLQSNPPIADVYIVGSDQVWAQLLYKKDNVAYFLDFGNYSVKRISYAASFSMDQYPSRIKAKLQKHLKRFDAISVREQSGSNICRELGVDSDIVVDPTMLLNFEGYLQLKLSKPIEKPYFFVYSINIKDAEQIRWEEINKLASSLGYELFVTPASGYFPGYEVFDDASYKYATIPEWLSLVNNSDMVVTTSFHGVVFSILFHTPFVFFPLEGKFGRGNTRILSLLEKLNLSSRVWDNASSYKNMLTKNIDWVKVDNLLEKERQRSLFFLIKNLG